MDENLKFLFTTVNEWLRFLEAKHTALIALNGAAIIGLVQSLSSIGNRSFLILIPYWLIPGLVLAVLISLFAMTKWASRVTPWRSGQRLRVPNALYFGYMSALDVTTLQAELARVSGLPQPLTESQFLLTQQIHTNAGIAYVKQRLFHWAITCTFGILLGCFVAFWLLRWGKALF